MSRTHLPSGHEAMAVLRLASSAEQLVLPYVHEISAGQQAGHVRSGFGGSAGQGGLGGALDPICQAPCVHRARRVPQSPKSQVVPSGREQVEPLLGAAGGHSAGASEPPSSPPSDSGVSVSEPSVQAAASVKRAEPTTRAAAIRAAVRASGRVAAGRTTEAGARVTRRE